jgi:hypothetical protein
MMDKEPFLYPSRDRFPFNPGVPDRQLWAIGMIVVQWGTTEFLRDQIIFNLIESDTSLSSKYNGLRASNQKTVFWQELVRSKMREPDRSKYLDFITRFQRLNNQRDDIIHRQWGGGMQPASYGAPADAEVTDAALHRHRDERIKTKSTDARANLRWRLSFIELRATARDMAALNSDIFISFLPPGSEIGGIHNVFAVTTPDGKLGVGVGTSENVQKTDD